MSANGVPPNLLLVEDRSCSMTGKVNGQTKWGIAVKAVQDLTTSYQGRIRFGLELFPDRGGNKCTEDQIQIPTGPSNEATIQSLLNSALDKADANFPSGPCVTPIDAAMQMAETDPALSDASRTSYVLLITDGEQAGCSAGGGDANTIQAITDLAARGVHTFVVGFGAAVSIPSLESFAVAGGEVNAKGPHKFYEAQDAASLGAALTIIGQQTLGCDLSLADPPPNGDVRLVFVYFNHAAPPIMRDPSHQSGWDYDPAVNQVHFYGQECDALRSGQSQSASVVFGCGGTLVPPPPPF